MPAVFISVLFCLFLVRMHLSVMLPVCTPNMYPPSPLSFLVKVFITGNLLAINTKIRTYL